MKFGEHLKQARIAKNLTQTEVAKHFFVSRQTISSWENEKTYPDMDSLIKLSDYYQISLDTLLKEDTGMREYLEKKDVAKELQAISKDLNWALAIILVILFAHIFDIINLHGLSVPLLIIEYLIVVINSHIRKFNHEKSLGIEYKAHEFANKHKWVPYLMFIIPMLILVVVDLAKEPKTEYLDTIIAYAIIIPLGFCLLHLISKYLNR